MSNELMRLELQLQQQNSVNSQLESELAALQQTRLGVKKSFDNNVKKLQLLNATNRTLESELAQLQQQLNALQAQLPPSAEPSAEPLRQSQAASANGVNDALLSAEQTQKLRKSRQKLTRLRTRLQTLNNNTAALQTQTAASQRTYIQRLNELNELEGRLRELNRWQLPLTNAQR